ASSSVRATLNPVALSPASAWPNGSPVTRGTSSDGGGLSPPPMSDWTSNTTMSAMSSAMAMPTATIGPQRPFRGRGPVGGAGGAGAGAGATTGAATRVAVTGAAIAVMGAPTSGRPRSKRRRSARRSWADWYRSSTSFAIAVSTMRSMAPGTSGTSDDGAAGVSRTCLYATDTGLAATNGAVPVSIS